MSKELTPLEALEQNHNFIKSKASATEMITLGKNYQIIETALKDYEKYKTIYPLMKAKLDKVSDDKLKLKMVLEIIKEKGIFPRAFHKSKNAEEYNDRLPIIDLLQSGFSEYTQEEFDLLKEVVKEYVL